MTVTEDAPVAAAHEPLYGELVQAGVLRPMTGRIEGRRAADGGGQNYVAPAGVVSIVEHLFAGASVSPVLSRRATSLRRAPSDPSAAHPTRGRWEVSAADGHRQLFDGVILTQPASEMLGLLETGEAGAWLEGAGSKTADGKLAVANLPPTLARTQLATVEYSARFALALFFHPDAASVFASHIDWTAKYVSKEEDDALVYIAIDSAKRASRTTTPDPPPAPQTSSGTDGAADGTGNGEANSLIAHTSVPFGLRTFAAGTSEDVVCADLRRRVQALLPWLPTPSDAVLKPWRLSQVRYPIALPPDAACVELRPPGTAGTSGAGEATPSAAEPPPPLLLLAGDAFSPLGSRFDGCVQSGVQAAEVTLRALGLGAPGTPGTPSE